MLRGMVVKVYRVFRHIVDDDDFSMLSDLMAMVVSIFSSSPGFSPKPMSSFTLQVTHRSSVTRATAQNPMPVVWQTTSRIVGTDLMPSISSMS